VSERNHANYGTNVAVRETKGYRVCIRDPSREEDTEGIYVHKKES
jgi:hypothetical protein